MIVIFILFFNLEQKRLFFLYVMWLCLFDIFRYIRQEDSCSLEMRKLNSNIRLNIAICNCHFQAFSHLLKHEMIKKIAIFK